MFQYHPFPKTPEEFVGWVHDVIGGRHEMLLVYRDRVFSAKHEGFVWTMDQHLVAIFRDPLGFHYGLSMDRAKGIPVVNIRKANMLVVCKCQRPICDKSPDAACVCLMAA